MLNSQGYYTIGRGLSDGSRIWFEVRGPWLGGGVGVFYATSLRSAPAWVVFCDVKLNTGSK